MSDNVIYPEQFVFGLDIGTRSIVGTIGYMDKNGFHVIAMEIKEHDTRAMLDGQVHDIAVVGEEIAQVKERLEKKIGRPLKSVCIAAAGRVLRTINVKVDSSMDEEPEAEEESAVSDDPWADLQKQLEAMESANGVGSAVTYDEPEPTEEEQPSAPPSADDSSIWNFGGSGSDDDDMSSDFGGFGGF